MKFLNGIPADSYDVVVVGSGAGGMTAALCAKGQGLSSVVLEKQNLYGGTSAVSGGGIWIPCNDDIPSCGGTDSPEEALTYLKGLTKGEVPLPRLEAYVRNAVQMVRYMAQRFGVRFRAVKKYPDYFPDHPGGKPGYRTMEPCDFDAAKLGEDYQQMRGPYKGTQLMGRISMDQVEAHILFTRAPGWIWLMLKMMGRYWFDFAWRRKTQRDRRLVLGQGMVAALRHAMQQQQVPLWLNTAMQSLVVVDGKVSGVEVRRNGQLIKLAARRGVVLASGGFESNQQMREQYLPKPTNAAWTAAPPINMGDGIRAGQSLGAATAFMNLTWGSPTVVTSKDTPACGIFVERALPGSVVVNKAGRRFVNEAAPYTEFVYAMYAEQARSGGGVPCWLVFDATFRTKFTAGGFMPSAIMPDWRIPPDFWDHYIFRADTVEALARKLHVPTEALVRTVANMNQYAKTGTDPEFGRGGNAYDRMFGDPTVTPNPCLGPITKAPYYAVPINLGDLGTKGGLKADAHARVLDGNDKPIPGLYAAGNCCGTPFGNRYPGAGATIGPAMTFGFVAADHIAARAGKAQAEPPSVRAAA